MGCKIASKFISVFGKEIQVLDIQNYHSPKDKELFVQFIYPLVFVLLIWVNFSVFFWFLFFNSLNGSIGYSRPTTSNTFFIFLKDLRQLYNIFTRVLIDTQADQVRFILPHKQA